jgi:YegS/Rv2252/BmrU family lipid kinase
MKPLVVIVFNPFSGRYSSLRLKELESLVVKKGFRVESVLNSYNEVRDIISISPSLIIIAGGDGTINEVINWTSESPIPLAIVPFGTTNVIAQELLIPSDISAAVEIALSGRVHNIALGRIHYSGRKRYFVMSLGIGFDGETVRNLNIRLKRFIGKGAYIISAIKTLSRWRPQALKIKTDKTPITGYSVIFSNISRYAGNITIAPDADIETPLLYMYLMKGKRKTDILRYAVSGLLGRHLRLKDILYMPIEQVEVDGTAHIQADGEYIGTTPAIIDIVPSGAKMIF